VHRKSLKAIVSALCAKKVYPKGEEESLAFLKARIGPNFLVLHSTVKLVSVLQGENAFQVCVKSTACLLKVTPS